MLIPSVVLPILDCRAGIAANLDPEDKPTQAIPSAPDEGGCAARANLLLNCAMVAVPRVPVAQDKRKNGVLFFNGYWVYS